MDKLLDVADDATWTYRSGGSHDSASDMDISERFLHSVGLLELQAQEFG